MKKFKKTFILPAWMAIFSLALGAAWTQKRLTNNAGDSCDSAVAVYDSNVYVVWSDFTPGNGEIYIRKSIDAGATWQTAKRLSYNAGKSYHPRIWIFNSNVYVVWSDFTPGNSIVYFKKSTDGGSTWQATKTLSNSLRGAFCPEITGLGSNVYVVWCDDDASGRNIYFRKSTDSGATWQTIKKLTNGTGNTMAPKINLYRGTLYVAWGDNAPGNYEIYISKSTDAGATWETAKRITNTAGFSGYPCLAVDHETLYMVWQEEAELYFRKSTNGGSTWQAAIKVTNHHGFTPTMARSGLYLYAVYQTDSPGNYEIYLKHSTNGGSTWQPVQRLSINTGISAYPFIAVNSSTVYVVWEDDTPGNNEIYIKYSLL